MAGVHGIAPLLPTVPGTWMRESCMRKPSLYNLENDMTDHLPCSMLLAYGVWHAVARGEGCTLVAYTGAHNEIRT